MLNIIACDNDNKDLETVKKLLEHYLCTHGELEGSARYFQDAAEMQREIESGMRAEIYLLDVLMPTVSGIKLGKTICEKDPSALIIYITSSREFALDAYGNNAVRYLLKPLRQDELNDALDFAVSASRRASSLYSVRTKDGMVSFDLREIVSVENSERTAVYTLSDGREIRSLTIRGAFHQAVAPLPEEDVILAPHKSFLVNMQYIQELRASSLVLQNGKIIPVSRRCFQEINRKYLKYLTRGEF